MKPNPDKDLILRILSEMPTATESQKREVIKMKCPYSVSSLRYKDWQKTVNKLLRTT